MGREQDAGAAEAPGGQSNSEATRPAGTTDPHRWMADHGDALLRYAMLRLGSEADAEEAVQETLAAALEARDSFRGDSTERTWLTGILRHKTLDILKRHARSREVRAELPSLLEGDPGDFKGGVWTERPADWSGVDASNPSETAELLAAVREEIAALPPMMRAVIALREIDGIPSDNVCEILDISPTNLWTLTHRAKLRLRKALSKRWFGEGGGATTGR